MKQTKTDLGQRAGEKQIGLRAIPTEARTAESVDRSRCYKPHPASLQSFSTLTDKHDY